uniref:BZIP domain-containing protein n=1 Tax=Meloidogyne floridensis TaxID=298350 RepID=A0A915NXF3_9BILA
MASSLTHSLAAAAHHRHGHTSPESFSTSSIHFHALDLSKNTNTLNTSCTNTKDSSSFIPNLLVQQQSTPTLTTIPPPPNTSLIIPSQQKQQQIIYQNLFSNNNSLIGKNIFGNSVEEQMQAVANVLLGGGNGTFQLQNVVNKCPKLLSEFINTTREPLINSLAFLQSAETSLPQMVKYKKLILLISLLFLIHPWVEILDLKLIRDDAYWERRRKNNYAAKRSRDTRRRKEDEVAVRAVILEQENLRLRFELERLRTEIERYRIVAFSQGIGIQQQTTTKNNSKKSEFFISGQQNGQIDSN